MNVPCRAWLAESRWWSVKLKDTVSVAAQLKPVGLQLLTDLIQAGDAEVLALQQFVTCPANKLADRTDAQPNHALAGTHGEVQVGNRLGQQDLFVGTDHVRFEARLDGVFVAGELTQFQALGKPIDAAAKKVKIIGIDSAADSKAFTSFLTTDNVAGGRIAADGLAAAIQAKYGKAEGDVALITSLPGVGSLDQRAKGFKEQLAAKYPGLKLIADKVADGQATTGLNIMTDLLTANPNLRGVFASNLIMAQGAGQATAENKKADTVKVIGFDSDPKTVKFLQDGVLAGLVVQDPFRMGYDGIKTALAASKGEQVPANVDTGANLITKADMGSERSQELLNPKVK